MVYGGKVIRKMDEDFSQVKVGDIVIWNKDNAYVKCVVDRITNTQIIVGGKKYGKRDGIIIYKKDKWSGCEYIMHLTIENEKKVNEYKLKIKRDNILCKIRNIDFKNISTKKLEEALKILSQVDENELKK
jgi:hypothetical protein